MKTVASLLGIPPQKLQHGLTMRTYLSQHGSVKSTCSAAGANSAKDALAKSLYIRTMVAVTRRINTLLKGAGGHSPQKGHNRKFPASHLENNPHSENLVHIVDLFGFECNETNSLEQLCVNWTAEKLHYLYTQFIFRDTLKSSQMEGINPFFESEVHNCDPCILLIGNNHSGILKELNQETLAPRVSAEDIRVRMKNQFGSNECFIPPAGSSSSFVIRHFHGDVTYDTYSILNANADTLADDIISIFTNKECKFGFVTHLFSAEASKELQSDGSPRGQMCRITPTLIQHSSQVESRQPTSFVQDFQAHIEDVVSTLRKSRPYFITCIKSNSTQTPGVFDRDTVSQQIDQLTIFETVDLIQGGYFHRMYYKDFVRRYQVIAPGALERLRSRAHEMTEDLLATFTQMLENKDVTEDMWAFGSTQIFLNEEFRQHLEDLRSSVRLNACIKIQSYVRMFLAMKQWPQVKCFVGEHHMQSRGMIQQQQQPSQSLSPPPPVPERQNDGRDPSPLGRTRNYTVVGDYRVAFPQWRVMRCSYPESGRVILNAGEEVYIVGRSQRRGFLIVEYGGKQFHVPHQYTELRIHSPPLPSLQHTVSPPHPVTTYSEL